MIDAHMVIDAHCHLGRSSISGVENTEAGLLAAMEAHGIDTALVLPHAFQDLEVADVHDRIARLAEQHPGKIYGIASLSPRLPEREYRQEATRCVQELGFRAIKLEPTIHAVAPHHQRAEIVFATAQELRVPVMIHTGMGSFTQPSFAISPAQRYPDVAVILAHAGFVAFGGEAIIAAQVCPNIVLEHSWCMSVQVAGMVRTLGADRVMYGSDHLSNIASELAKVQALDFDETQLAQVLGGTAARVFGLTQKIV
jgi:predicted TIM-barrel fold metal-dependent hydrolase